MTKKKPSILIDSQPFYNDRVFEQWRHDGLAESIVEALTLITNTLHTNIARVPDPPPPPTRRQPLTIRSLKDKLVFTVVINVRKAQ